jgi:hypothetical protein
MLQRSIAMMFWEWFVGPSERERIDQKIALSAYWNEGYQAGYRTAAAQNRCDCGKVHRCSDNQSALKNNQTIEG